MSDYVYVLDRDGHPLMPTKRYGWVRRALDSGMAHPVRTVPFTIRLAYEAGQKKQSVSLNIDPGRTNIGLAANRQDGGCLFRAKVVTRNKEIPKLMAGRRTHRQASRRGERLARKRLAKKLGTTMKGILERKLPGYGEGTVVVKDIINTEARFNNRVRPEGWLTPTAKHLLRTHENVVRLVEQILPITGIGVELNRFDFVRMEDPNVSRWRYRCGPLAGYESLRDAVSAMQDGKCLLCDGNGIDHDHHIIPRSKGGSDTIANIAGVCTECHALLHTSPEAVRTLALKKAGLNKKYHALSVLNQIIGKFISWCAGRYPKKTRVCRGYDTKQYREEHGLAKDHDIDAYCIGMVTAGTQAPDGDMPPCHTILQFRRHNRAIVHSQRPRYYYLDGVKAAQNRRPAYEAMVAADGTVKDAKQKARALSVWFDEMVKKHGRIEAERMRSRLTVKPSYRRYNDPERIMPGAVFVHRGRRHVMSGQLTNGAYLRAYGNSKTNFPSRDCRIARNTGLVFAV